MTWLIARSSRIAPARGSRVCSTFVLLAAQETQGSKRLPHLLVGLDLHRGEVEAEALEPIIQFRQLSQPLKVTGNDGIPDALDGFTIEGLERVTRGDDRVHVSQSTTITWSLKLLCKDVQPCALLS